tara:strand:- start:2635 stop:2835 length:201 start_codon:yes stop_codon:yes gene_type:complete
MNERVLKQPFIDYSFSLKAQERAQTLQDAGRLTIKKHFNSSLFDTEPSQLSSTLNKLAREKHDNLK